MKNFTPAQLRAFNEMVQRAAQKQRDRQNRVVNPSLDDNSSSTNQPMSDCEERLSEYKAKLIEFDEFADAIMSEKTTSGVIINKNKRKVRKRMGYTAMVGSMPIKCYTIPGDMNDYRPGDLVLIAKDVIVGYEETSPIGDLFTVSEALFEGKCTVAMGEGGRSVFARNFDQIEPGDKVLLDPSRLTVLAHHKTKKEVQYEAPLQSVPWDSIGGLDEEKQAIRDAIETPRKFKHLFEAYGQRPPRGMLLLGPPGTGKTMLAKAAATSMAEMNGGTAGSGFIYIKGPELLSKWVGESESSVRGLFSQARKHKAKHGYDAVIFIDEADAILSARGSGNASLSNTLVPAFLAELDGLEDPGCFMLLATNRPDQLDSAVTRDGRIDRKLLIRRPDPVTARSIVDIHSKKLNHLWPQDGTDIVVDALWEKENEVFIARSQQGQTFKGYLHHFISGAMLAGIVARSKMYAINRDVGIKSSRASGIKHEDIKAAIRDTHAEIRNTRHDEVAMEIAQSMGLMANQMRVEAV